MYLHGKRSWMLAGCAVWLLVTVLPVAAAERLLSGPGELQILIDEGIAQNHTLKAHQERIRALETEAPAASVLDDPVIGMGLLNLPTDTFDLDQEAMTQKQIFISQKLPWFGKRDLKTQVLWQKAASETERLKARKLALARELADRYYRLWFVRQSLSNNRQLMELLRQVRKVAEIGYASGRGLEKDLIQAELEISRLTDKRIVLETEERVLESEMNGLLNREAPITIRTSLNLPIPEALPPREQVRKAVLENNPGLRAVRIDRESARIDIEMARKTYWPNSEWRLAYGQRDEIMGRDLADFVSATVMFNLPLWQGRKQAPRLTAEKRREQAADHDIRNLMTLLPHRADALWDEIRNLKENNRLYQEELIPQADQLARSAMSSYQVGRLDFDTMIRIQMRRLEVKLKADQYRRMRLVKTAMLEEMTGGPVLNGTLSGKLESSPDAVDDSPGEHHHE